MRKQTGDHVQAIPVETNSLNLDPVGILRVFITALQYRKTIVITGFVVAFVTALVLLFQPRTYTTTTSFVPDVPRQSGFSIDNLAARFGITIPTGQMGASAVFYADLIWSQEIIDQVVDTEFMLPGADEPATLIDFFEIEADDDVPPAVLHARAGFQLRSSLQVRHNRQTNLVTLTVTTESAEWSHLIASRFIELLDEFNQTRRQSRAAAERVFIEGQLAEAQRKSDSAEFALRQFLLGNRDFARPNLVFEHDRLQRVVSMNQQVLISLLRSYEEAKIEEVRDTPVLTIIQRPVVAVFPNPRRRRFKVMAALVFGLLLGTGLAFGTEAVRRTVNKDTTEINELRQLGEDVGNDLRRLLPGKRRHG